MQAALHSAVRYKWQFTASTPLARCPAPRRPASLRRQVRLQVVMVEGHQCHRVGAAHRRLLLGKAFAASSPNGRFADGAAAISGKVLRDIQVHGKNLFYFFSGRDADGGSGSTAGGDRAPLSLAPEDVDPLAEPEDADTEFGGNGGTAASPQAAARRQASGSPLSAPGTPGQGLLGSLGAAASAAAAAAEDAVVVHIHFGMSGAFRTALLPGPEATPTTRLRLEHSGSGLVAHLSAMTVAHGSMDLYRDRVGAPLHHRPPPGLVGLGRGACQVAAAWQGVFCVVVMHAVHLQGWGEWLCSSHLCRQWVKYTQRCPTSSVMLSAPLVIPPCLACCYCDFDFATAVQAWSRSTAAW
jgi:hypothetical protein